MHRSIKLEAAVAVILSLILIAFAFFNFSQEREPQKAPDEVLGHPNLIGYWSFDSEHRNELTVFDISQNENNGTINGVTFLEGADGDGARFDGIDSYIEIRDQDNILSGMDELSISFYINKEVTGPPRSYLFKRTLWGPYSFRAYGDRQEIRPFIRNKTSDYEPILVSVSILPKEYIHYIFTYNGTDCSQYINGRLARIDPCAPGGIQSQTGSLFLGKDYPGENYHTFNGSLDELAIFNKSLSQEEIQELFGSFGCGDEICSDIETYLTCYEDCYDLNLAGEVKDTEDFKVWYADSTQKILPSFPSPESQTPAIPLKLAKNEARFFQVAINPKTTISATLSLPENQNFETNIFTQEIVPIVTSSDHFPHFIGDIYDPLIKKPEAQLQPGTTSAFVIEIITNETTPSGNHTINLTINDEEIPIEIYVYDFALPDKLTLATAFDSGHFRTKYEDLPGCEATSVFEFHGLPEISGPASPEELAVVDAYYENYAKNKIVPYSPHEFRDFTHDCETGEFDFAEMDAALEKYLDKLSMNRVMVKHYGGWWYEKAYPLCDINLTHEDYEELATAYYGNVTRHMEEKGWINYSYIMIDEPHGIHINFTRDLAKIITKNVSAPVMKIGPALNDHEDYKILNNSINLWIPNNNEKFIANPYYIPELSAALLDQGDEVWWYYTKTKAFDIDSPALDNTLYCWAAWSHNITGILNWAGLIYDTHCSTLQEGREMYNPWYNPRPVWGNGQVSFYYPPCKDVCSEPTYEVVPSLRVKLYREGIQDYEYFEILEKKIRKAKSLGIDPGLAEQTLKRINEVVLTPTSWKKDPSLVSDIRKEIAESIEHLQEEISCGSGGCSSLPPDNPNNGDGPSSDSPPQDPKSETNVSTNESSGLDYPMNGTYQNETTSKSNNTTDYLAINFEGTKNFVAGLIISVLVIAALVTVTAIRRSRKKLKQLESQIKSGKTV